MLVPPSFPTTVNPLMLLRSLMKANQRPLAALMQPKHTQDMLLMGYYQSVLRAMPLPHLVGDSFAEEKSSLRRYAESVMQMTLDVKDGPKDFPLLDTAAGSYTDLMNITAKQFAEFKTQLNHRRYRREPEITFMGLILLEYRPTARTGGRNLRPFLPSISLVMDSEQSLIYDVFVGTERLSPFHYGVDANNQFVTPVSEDGTVSVSRILQYELGLMSALRTVLDKIDAGRKTVNLFRRTVKG